MRLVCLRPTLGVARANRPVAGGRRRAARAARSGVAVGRGPDRRLASRGLRARSATSAAGGGPASGTRLARIHGRAERAGYRPRADGDLRARGSSWPVVLACGPPPSSGRLPRHVRRHPVGHSDRAVEREAARRTARAQPGNAALSAARTASRVLPWIGDLEAPTRAVLPVGPSREETRRSDDRVAPSRAVGASWSTC